MRAVRTSHFTHLSLGSDPITAHCPRFGYASWSSESWLLRVLLCVTKTEDEEGRFLWNVREGLRYHDREVWGACVTQHGSSWLNQKAFLSKPWWLTHISTLCNAHFVVRDFLKNLKHFARFGVLSEVTLKNTTLWHVRPCKLSDYTASQLHIGEDSAL
jgi:hypothetical protein